MSCNGRCGGCAHFAPVGAAPIGFAPPAINTAVPVAAAAPVSVAASPAPTSLPSPTAPTLPRDLVLVVLAILLDRMIR